MMSIGTQAANVPSIMKAKASAIPVFSIIDEPSALDIRKPEGRNLNTIEKGKIEFINCYFNYPSRAQKVMENFSLEIPAGSKIALVGHSGCGKSTLTNILLRFYNINEGKVLIDGEDLDKYNVLKLRD
jgi:ABC-type multidrug transport system fused ATPase/permease subunit